jgi:uncharacterized protein (TIGR02453 family)
MSLKIIPFLAELTKNNNKEWFDNHREQYDVARKELVAFATELVEKLGLTNPWVSVLNPSKCVYRINRDIRFSKDKTPYKKALNIFIAPGGRSSGNAGYYLHIEPLNSYMGGGIFGPSPEVLRAIRQEIYFNSEKFIEILNEPVFKETFGEMMDERLIRPPKGFPADFKHIELLKYKHFAISHPFDLEDISRDEILPQLLPLFEAERSFIDFLNEAITNSE